MQNLTLYFDVLELQPGATHEQIRQSYRDMVNVWHPDRFENNPRLKEKATHKLQRINAAYANLKNYQPSTRAAESGTRHKSRQEHQQTRYQEKQQHTAKPNTDSASKIFWTWRNLSRLVKGLLPSMRHGQVIVVVLAIYALYATGHINIDRFLHIADKIIVGAMYVVAFFMSIFRQKPAEK